MIAYGSEIVAKTMSRRLKLIASVLTGILVPLSCSVKEDRAACPCHLKVELELVGKDYGNVEVAVCTAYGIESATVCSGDYGMGHLWQVPKGYVHSICHSGMRCGILVGTDVLIEYGNDADSLWSHYRLVDCSGETAVDTVLLCKQFAFVNMKIVGAEGEACKYGYELEGDICGINLLTMKPLKGMFSKILTVDSEGVCSFILPRQENSSSGLFLDVSDSDGVAATLPIGEWILESGYDWEEKNLRDIEIILDFAIPEVTVSVGGWSEGKKVEVLL